jgi:cell division protein FtsB
VRALYNRRRDELARLKARDEALVAEVAQLLGGAPPTPDERRIIASRLGLKDSPEEIAAALRSKRERQPSRKKRAVVDRPPGGD